MSHPMGYILDPERIPPELEPFKDRLSPNFYEVRKRIIDFIKQDILPAMPVYGQQYREEVAKLKDRKPASPHEDAAYTNHPVWAASPPIAASLRQKAQERGLYNFFLPEVGKLGVLEYAPICEILGAFGLCNVAMNCTAPDTGNMEVLEKYGTEEQKKQWLEPLLAGTIRSAYAMTEPGVASSDATNISATIQRDGDEYVINGHKWYISGACRPECKVFIFLGRSGGDSTHKQHSMILVPRDAKGVHIIRPLGLFGHIHDHAEIVFDNVRVPVGNMLLGEGRGFEIAQAALALVVSITACAQLARLSRRWMRLSTECTNAWHLERPWPIMQRSASPSLKHGWKLQSQGSCAISQQYRRTSTASRMPSPSLQ